MNQKLRSQPRLVWILILTGLVLNQPAHAAAPPASSIGPIGPAITLTGGVAGPRFPADKAKDVNPDTHLFLTFSTPPKIGNTGQIRIYDAATDQRVDTLDLSIPAGPHTLQQATAPGANAPGAYQLTVIGGFKEGFHFYPVIINENTATIYPHNNTLTYGKTYYVQIDPGALTLDDGSFKGVSGTAGWTFSTKKSPPVKDADPLIVAADGSGDFNTVQGAVDFTADKNDKRVTIFIKSGAYQEIVYFRNKTNLTFVGEDREKVVVGYANDQNFNIYAPGTTTNELPNTFPYRRVAFMADHSSGIHLFNFTIKNLMVNGGQCEALLLMGGKNIVSHVSLYGHTDTLQFNDSVYITDSYIEGGGDFIWGRGPAFFNNCEIKELGASAMMWVRSTAASHGFVFLNCKMEATGGRAIIARNTAQYPNSEVVLLNCALGEYSPAGFTLAGDTTNQHYWEFNSTNLSDGKPADVSRRHPGSKQLDQIKDAETIANYRNPTYVLGGWTPILEPMKILETSVLLSTPPLPGQATATTPKSP